MLPMSNADIAPGAVESQQMRIIAPPGVRTLSGAILIFSDDTFAERGQVKTADIVLDKRATYTRAD